VTTSGGWRLIRDQAHDAMAATNSGRMERGQREFRKWLGSSDRVDREDHVPLGIWLGWYGCLVAWSNWPTPLIRIYQWPAPLTRHY
jgi:hypothetical protein